MAQKNRQQVVDDFFNSHFSASLFWSNQGVRGEQPDTDLVRRKHRLNLKNLSSCCQNLCRDGFLMKMMQWKVLCKFYIILCQNMNQPVQKNAQVQNLHIWVNDNYGTIFPISSLMPFDILFLLLILF